MVYRSRLVFAFGGNGNDNAWFLGLGFGIYEVQCLRCVDLGKGELKYISTSLDPVI